MKQAKVSHRTMERRLRGTKNRNGTVRFFRVRMEIRIVLRTVVVETKHTAHIIQRNRMLSLGKYWERVLCYIILNIRTQHALYTPYARIVVGCIQLYIANVRRMKIKLAILWVV